MIWIFCRNNGFGCFQQLVPEGLCVGYTSQRENTCLSIWRKIGLYNFPGINGKQLTIFYSGEEQILVRPDVQILCNDSLINGLDLPGTFGNDDDIGPVPVGSRFPQATQRKQIILRNHARIINQQDVDGWSHVAVLKSIVQNDDIRSLFADRQNFLNTPYPLLIDSHHHRWEFHLDLQRFIPGLVAGGARLNDHKTPTLAFVSATQHGDVKLLA